MNGAASHVVPPTGSLQRMRRAKPFLAVLLVGVFLTYLWTARFDLLSALRGLKVSQVASVGALLAVQWVLRASRDRSLFANAGYRLELLSLLRLGSVQVALNYLPLKAGTWAAGSLLHHRSGVAWRDFIGVTSLQVLYNSTVAAALAAGALFYSRAVASEGAWTLLIVYLTIVAGGVAVVLWNRPAELLARLVPVGVGAASGVVRVIHGARRIWLRVVVLTALSCLVSGIRMWTVFSIVSVQLTLPDAIVISGSLMLSPLLAITPGGLGVAEATVGVTAVILGESGQLAVVAGVLDRMLILAMAVLTGMVMQALAQLRSINQ